jgi:hypothetical protein
MALSLATRDPGTDLSSDTWPMETVVRLPLVRRARGNIILTALFVAIFLFFLSIALIWTNRQDIALSLAMEHKMKGEAAARTGAMKVYAGLRNFDIPPASMEGTLESGAAWKAELVELPPEGGRGPLVLLRCRGTSGPLSSYFTLHLLKSELGPQLTEPNGRLLGFLPPGMGVPQEGPECENEDKSAGLLTGDFELKRVDLGFDDTAEWFAANQGPLFVSGKLPSPASPLDVCAYLPVFHPITGVASAYGPLIITVPEPEAENGLSVMNYQGDQIQWEPIPFPTPEPEDLDPPPISVLALEVKGESWNTLVARSVGDTGVAYSWQDDRPATNSKDEAIGLSATQEFAVDTARAIEWSRAPSTANQRGYALNGAIAAYGQTVYSFAWEYSYRHFDGTAPPIPVPEFLGNTVTRWPCVRKYNLEEKRWSTVWSALKDNGDVTSPILPDAKVLLVDSDGHCFSRTLNEPLRLIELEPGGNVTLGEPVSANGRLFMYRNAPHTISEDPSKPGIVNLKNRSVIGFETLPALIPEISGPVVLEVENENLPNGLSELEISPLRDGEETPQMRTVRRGYDLSYGLDSSSSVATDGDDLYTQLTVTLKPREPSYEMFGTFKLEGGGKMLARYDGTRWHILPNGLLAALTNSLGAPSGEMFCAHYNGLPSTKSRYSVVSVDTDPFEFKQ